MGLGGVGWDGMGWGGVGWGGVGWGRVGWGMDPTGYLWFKYDCFLISGCKDIWTSRKLQYRNTNF